MFEMAESVSSNKHFTKVAQEVLGHLRKVAVVDRNAEWQRVHNAIADLVKDVHFSYAKMIRLQGDFDGSELKFLEKISEQMLDIGGELSEFARDFYSGSLSMVEKGFSYGDGAPSGGAPAPQPGVPTPPVEGGTPPQEGASPAEGEIKLDMAEEEFGGEDFEPVEEEEEELEVPITFDEKEEEEEEEE